MGTIESHNQKQIHFCAICNGPGSTKHHLWPQKLRRQILNGAPGNSDSPSWGAVMRVCGSCHADIHFYFSHWELAMKYNEPERIKTEMAKRKASDFVWFKHKKEKAAARSSVVALNNTHA